MKTVDVMRSEVWTINYFVEAGPSRKHYVPPGKSLHVSRNTGNYHTGQEIDRASPKISREQCCYVCPLLTNLFCYKCDRPTSSTDPTDQIPLSLSRSFGQDASLICIIRTILITSAGWDLYDL